MTQLSGLTLAYLGDAIFEVKVREHLLNKGFQKVDNLHKEAIKYTSATGQAKAFDAIENVLSEEEISVFKRGRNANTDRKARNADLATYKKATGFEAIIGYLHISEMYERLDYLLEQILN